MTEMKQLETYGIAQLTPMSGGSTRACRRPIHRGRTGGRPWIGRGCCIALFVLAGCKFRSIGPPSGSQSSTSPAGGDGEDVGSLTESSKESESNGSTGEKPEVGEGENPESGDSKDGAGDQSSGQESDGKGGEKSDDKDGTTSEEGQPEDSPEPGPMLGNLPRQELERVVHGVFTSAHECKFCHTDSDGVLQNSSTQSVAPNQLWQSSMMAFSARDPYWLAQFSHELQANPKAKDAISDKCTRCHAPVANESMRLLNKKISFDLVSKDGSPIAKLGREGVTCSLCHQISDQNQGKPDSYTGNYVVGTNREIWGPHEDPFPNPMRMRLNYFVKASAHMIQSAHCASCHTVFTHPLDATGKPTETEFAEQVPFLEWKNSDYSRQGKTCQSCHMPRQGRDGHDFTTVLSNRPRWLDTQREVGDHGFVGGNAYMLELLAHEREWAGIATEKAEILEAAARTEEFLRTTVSMKLVKGENDASVLVKLINNAGHRFPTAYPSRRAWLEVVSEDKSGQVVFHSGGFDATGRIQDVKLPIKHLARIDRPNQVQIYEGVMADGNNRPTHTLLAAHQWWKDNRLLPKGWREDHVDARWTKPKGVQGDGDFVAGSDTIEYRLPKTSAKVMVKLWYQTVPPESVEALSKAPTPASRRFRALTQKHPTLPKLVVSKEIDL